ncbi:restriction endonuclease subunit S [Streptomyces sp. NPDC002785]|uniref:restriction endonuclease subunit S n=1 Tax=Streptomyces sp. NPDC002785 TaxID=3154543 RepID=UPI0033236DB0
MTWENTRLKYLCVDSGQYGLNIPSDSYTTSGIRLIRTSDITSSGMLKPADTAVYVETTLEARHQLRQGDVLLSRSGTLGRSFLAPAEADSQTFAGFLVRFRPKDNIDPRFLQYVTQSALFQGIVHAEAVSSTIQNFNADRYANIPIRAPGEGEQRRIADFLDAETSRIDRLSTMLQNSVSLLEKRITGVIDDELSAAADRIIPLKYLASLVDTEHKTAPHVPGGGYWIVGTSAVRNGLLNHDALYETDVNAYREWTRRRRPRPGDVLLSREAPVGEIAMYRTSDPHIAIGQRMVLVSPNSSDIEAEYLTWALLSSRVSQFFDVTTQGSLHPHLNMRDIGSIPVIWCDLQRQAVALRHIDTEVRSTRALCAARTQMQQLIAERRQALITAAVTGQFDVSTASGRNVTDGVQA